MSEIRVRKLSSQDIKNIDRLVEIKKFPSRESYLRHLIQKDLNEEISMTSHIKYTRLVEELLHYLEVSNDMIRENHELISFFLSKIDIK